MAFTPIASSTTRRSNISAVKSTRVTGTEMPFANIRDLNIRSSVRISIGLEKKPFLNSLLQSHSIY